MAKLDPQHFAFQSSFAQATSWGINHGWQTEIAIWNLGMIIVLVPIVRDEFRSRAALPGLFVLSLFFGINHLYAALAEGSRTISGNIAGATANGFAVILCLIYWLRGSS